MIIRPGVIVWRQPEIRTQTIQVLFCGDVEYADDVKFLDWVPLASFYTRKQALALDVSYVGPMEDVVWEILELFRDVYECALKTSWSFEKEIEFYQSFPFDELPTREAVMAFRRTLFRCPAFADLEYTFPETE